MNNDLVSYYKDRAKEYEKIYSKPERQADLKEATGLLQELFDSKEVVEIACGTGYWTERIAATAKAVLATDINDTVLELARKKDYAGKQVAFEIADLYEFAPDKPFESLFGGFIWSHIPVQELNRFLATMKRLVVPGGTVVLMDNRYVEGSNLPITHSDEHGNTFQTRKLEDGSTHQVLKNFPSEVFLREQIEGRGGEMSYWKMEYYWLLSWTTP